LRWIEPLQEKPGNVRVVRVLATAALLVAVPSAASILFNWFRPHGIPLVSDTDYRDEILVPCPENLKEATAVYLDTLPRDLGGLSIVDARSAAAFAGGHPAGAINIPHRSMNTGDAAYREAVRADLGPLRGTDGRRVVVCGDAANDSGRGLAALLTENGFEGVRYVVEGCEAFEAAGCPYERPRLEAIPVAPGDLPDDLVGFTVVDARLSPRAFKGGRLPNAVRFPASKVEGPDDPRLDPLRGAVDAPVLVYGSAERDEGRSLAQFLSANGWNDVRHLEGGIEAWEAAGKPVERGDSEEGAP
jgi:rhodanese-related sulfurtransferase